MTSSPAPSGPFAVMPNKTADLDETWTFLNAGVDHIMNNIEEGLSFTGYTNLYTTVYNYCTSTKMHGRLDGNRCMLHTRPLLSKPKAESRLPLAGANLVGSDLYNKLSDYFIRHFQGMLQVSVCLILTKAANWLNPQKTEVLEDVDLLRYYASEWDRYTRGANYVNRLFTFLNRNWVLRERREGNNRILQVYSVRYCLLFITFHLIDSNI